MRALRRNPTGYAVDEWVRTCWLRFADQIETVRWDPRARDRRLVWLADRMLKDTGLGTHLNTVLNVLCATHLARPRAGMLDVAQHLVDAILAIDVKGARRVARWMKAEDLVDYTSMRRREPTTPYRYRDKPITGDHARRAAVAIVTILSRVT